MHGFTQDTALHAVVRLGRLAAVKALVNAGAEVRRACPFLVRRKLEEHNAELGAFQKHMKLQKHRENSTLSTSDGHGIQPLHLAAFAGHVAVFDYLVAQGAEPSAPSGWENLRPVHYTMPLGHLAALEHLVKMHGAEVTVAHNYGWQPIHIATLMGHAMIVEELLGTWGAEATQRISESGQHFEGDYPEDGRHLLHIAAGAGYYHDQTWAEKEDIMKHLPSSWQHARVKERASAAAVPQSTVGYGDGFTGRRHRSENTYLKIVKQLTMRGVEVTAPDSRKSFPVHFASGGMGDTAILEHLTANGADVRAKNTERMKKNTNKEALHFAAALGYQRIMEHLIAQGAETTARSEDMETTPLIRAAASGSLAAVEVLLTKAPPSLVNMKAADDTTALQEATVHGYLAIAERLTRSGAEAISSSDILPSLITLRPWRFSQRHLRP